MILAFNIADIIRVPFGYLLDLLYQFTTSYGLALILFALIVKLILLPASAKKQKKHDENEPRGPIDPSQSKKSTKTILKKPSWKSASCTKKKASA